MKAIIFDMDGVLIRIYTNIGNNVNFYYYLCWSTLLPISIIALYFLNGLSL